MPCECGFSTELWGRPNSDSVTRMGLFETLQILFYTFLIIPRLLSFSSCSRCEAPDFRAVTELGRGGGGHGKFQSISPTVLTAVQQFSWNKFSSDCCKYWFISRALKHFIQTIFVVLFLLLWKGRLRRPPVHHPRIPAFLTPSIFSSQQTRPYKSDYHVFTDEQAVPMSNLAFYGLFSFLKANELPLTD